MPDVVSFHRLPNQIDAAPDGSALVVGYGDYIGPVLVTDDPWRLPRGQQLALALRAAPGADPAAPVAVGHENATGLLEDDFVRYECRIRPTPANVLALWATRFAWTAAAERLAGPVAPPAGAVAAVRQGMAEHARRDLAAHDRVHELIRLLSAADRGSAEAAALAAELRELVGSPAAPGTSLE
ncbi:hypothetical protein [Urbifossiella limnaea]|uniref:Uncharacterized protein n=1 Tax=Urbifossiella limnaea TaxID=2528023 RepID=A0A517XUX9_9BACT|nr:hypothetical protein [Urbifossiella limnaea]QDU21303.1 hypothetical protein ETAA1_32690 [Urbifossiella limnaea]